MPDPGDIKLFAQPRAVALGLDWPTIDRQGEQESGWRQWDAAGNVLTSSGGAKGIGQLNAKYYPPSDWQDPYANVLKWLSIMAANLRKYRRYREALAAYNWGPGHVGGGRFDDGRGFGVQDHSPWDGTRDWRCSAGHGVSAQCLRYLDVILGPGWPEPNAKTPPEVPVPPSSIVYDDYRDPHPAGTFGQMPSGIILHGSRSGKAGNPKGTEYAGTASYERTNPDGLGWNATIGENHVAVHLEPTEWGWNARAASDNYLAVEMAQATADEPITDAQVAAFADWVRTRVLPVWPGLPLVFPTHAELDGTAVYGGYHDGKTDAFPLGDPRADDLRARIMAALGAQQPDTGGNPDSGADLGTLVGVAYHEDGVIIPALVNAHQNGDWSQVDAAVKFLRENNPHKAA